MPVNGQVVDAVAIILEIAAKPVRKFVFDYFDGFAEAATHDNRPATAGFAGKNNCETLVLGACPHCDLAETRKTGNTDLICVYVRVGNDIIHNSA